LLKKKFFTLLEIIICFTIIAMIGSTMSLWVVKRIEKDRFYSDIKRFKNSLLFCNKMAKIRQSDIIFIITQTSDGLKYEIKNFSLPLKKNLITYSSMKSKEKKNIKTFRMEIYPNGVIYPKKSIYFFSKNEKYIKEFNPNFLQE
jgi:hypothetical protein